MREGAELRVPEQERNLGELGVALLEVLEREAPPRLLHEVAVGEASIGEPAAMRP